MAIALNNERDRAARNVHTKHCQIPNTETSWLHLMRPCSLHLRQYLRRCQNPSATPASAKRERLGINKERRTGASAKRKGRGYQRTEKGGGSSKESSGGLDACPWLCMRSSKETKDGVQATGQGCIHEPWLI
eukprot:366237-Chlamydomonas_euryale.AAC.5